MIVEPELRVADFAKAGADIISVHCEQSATIHLHRTLGQIKELGCLAGAVLNPGTPLRQIEECLDLCDLVLIMSVNPGFGGQKFIESQVEKIKALRAMCNERVCSPLSARARLAGPASLLVLRCVSVCLAQCTEHARPERVRGIAAPHLTNAVRKSFARSSTLSVAHAQLPK